MKKVLLISVILAICVSAVVFAKRLEPKPVDKIVHKGIEHSAPHNLMGCVVARDIKTGVRIWWKQIYAVKYNPELEMDVQDVFIKEMKLKDNKLIIRDERNHKYELDLSSLKVKE